MCESSVCVDSDEIGSAQSGLQLGSPEDVEVQVPYRLTGIRAIVGDHPVAAVVQPPLLRHSRSQRQRVGGDVLIFRPNLAQRREMPPRDDENMHRSLRLQIAERDIVLALGDELRPELAPRDAAENAIGRLGIGHPLPRWKFSLDQRRGTLPRPLLAALRRPDRHPSMPELPEVETVRRSLIDKIVGRHILALRLTDFPGVLGGDRAEDVLARIQGREVTQIRRRAKYLIVELDDGTAVVVHLRMTGKLSAVPRAKPPLRFERLAIEFDGDLDLRFSDQRKFGRVTHLQDDELASLEQRLGREPLEQEFTAEWLQERLRRRPGKIKAVLLDQGLIGGLGNIYVDESLFRAGVHPERRANTLTPAEVRRIHRAIRDVLRAAVDRKGTTFSSFEDAEGNPGRYGHRLRIYGRGGKGPCPTCGAPLERTIVGGRGTSFCPTCQPLDAATESTAPESPPPIAMGEGLG
jgi:formamidopyrimidine-DNA glycosylase